MTELKPAARERAGALSGHVRVAVWFMRVIWDHFGITSGLLCGSFGYMKVIFKKTFIFQIDFNDFTKNSDHFGIDLVSFGSHFGVIFGIWEGFGALSEAVRRRKA